MSKTSLLTVLGMLSFVACATESAENTDSSSLSSGQEKVVYGADNRRDVYAETDAALKKFVSGSIVAMIPSTSLVTTDPTNIRLRNTGTYGSQNGLCSGEKFGNQPAAANCSGTLVGDDLVLTAGHCVEDNACAQYKWVFDYSLASATSLTKITADDVYSCKKIEKQVLTNSADYAVVRLDRKVSAGHTPAKLRDQITSPVRTGESVWMAGSPSGLPVKITDDAKVTGLANGFFRASLDAFAGNSGSGVFDPDTFELVGILVRGNNDFSYDRTRRCYVPQQCTAGTTNRSAGCSMTAEEVSYPPSLAGL